MSVPGSWEYNGTVTVGIWAKKAGVWQKIMQDNVSVSQGTTGSNTATLNWFEDIVVQMGSGVQAVGLTIDGYSGTAAALSAFSHLIWQAQGAGSGERSATPASQKSTVTVRP
jgi:hypothetical protein